jgi:ADP-dependent NAD(P)H-hydrate dehydratase / NAD(P)H-hydrate epimerase
VEPVLTPAQMRAADERTIASGTPGILLMERAGFACTTVALRMLGGAYGKRAVVVAGKGNNGGDGAVAARHLASSGVAVTLLLLAEPAGDAAHHVALARQLGSGRLRVLPWSSEAFARSAHGADLAIDAVLGTGFQGEPKGAVAEALHALDGPRVRVLAADIPSGVAGADGSVPGVAARAAVTVAIQALKVGHVLPPGAFRCGRVDVADVGIAVGDADVCVPEAADVLAALPGREPDTHKYAVGAVAVLGGSSGMSGAVALTGLGAVRSGAGLVLLGVPHSVLPMVESTVTEAVKVGLPETEGHLDPKSLDEFRDRVSRAAAMCVGPGLGRAPRTVELVRRVLDLDLPLVVDADGLWALGEIMGDEPDVLHGRAHATVLTPHAGEFVFLSGEPPSQDRIASAAQLAERTGAIVHLKGRRAVTASPSGRAWVNATGNPAMATAGSGDVLTGIIGSLLAQGAGAESATWAGAYLHGLAGDLASSRAGGAGVAARDLPEAIPLARRRLGPPSDVHAIRTVLADPSSW